MNKYEKKIKTNQNVVIIGGVIFAVLCFIWIVFPDKILKTLGERWSAAVLVIFLGLMAFFYIYTSLRNKKLIKDREEFFIGEIKKNYKRTLLINVVDDLEKGVIKSFFTDKEKRVKINKVYSNIYENKPYITFEIKCNGKLVLLFFSDTECGIVSKENTNEINYNSISSTNELYAKIMNMIS